MFWVIFGSYIFFLAVVWGVFIVIRIHALKFENFQTLIRKIIRVMCVSLAILSILGFVMVYRVSNEPIKSSKLDIESPSDIDSDIDINFY